MRSDLRPQAARLPLSVGRDWVRVATAELPDAATTALVDENALEVRFNRTYHPVRVELHRTREGELPETSAEALDLHEWRTAPAELVRTNPNRPELPAAEPVLPELNDETFDLGL